MKDLFEGIKPSDKKKIMKLLEANAMTFPPNTSVLSYVKWNNLVGYIISGYIQIIREDYNGNRTIIENLSENSLFGSSLSTLKNNEIKVITKEETILLIIDYHNIIDEQKAKYSYYNKFIRNLLEITMEKVKDKNKQIEILTKKSIRDKLLEYFKILSSESKTKIIYFPMNYTELADFIAVDRSAMTREIKNLIDEGFIKKDGRKITLLY